MKARRRLAALIAAAACLVGTSGCAYHGIFSLPLPGAVGNGSNTYTVSVQFADVLDLVPYSAVKVNDATVGHVQTVSLQGSHALVTCRLLDTVHLPRNATAQIEETSLLGEKFVEIDRPADLPAEGRLSNGDLIPLAHTGTDATVEEVLGALSALLNGGGVQQIHTIAQEVNTALNGRTSAARHLLGELRTFATGLNQQKGQILRAIAGLDTLARTVRSQEGELVTATEQIPPALAVLTGDRSRLTGMLVALRHLGDVAVRVVNRSQRNLVTNLRNLEPTLDRLSRVGTYIPKTLGILITYPTADSVEKEYLGDYGNLSLTIDLHSSSLLTFLKGLQVGNPPTTRQTSTAHSPSRSRVQRRSGSKTGHRLLPRHPLQHHPRVPKLPLATPSVGTPPLTLPRLAAATRPEAPRGIRSLLLGVLS